MPGFCAAGWGNNGCGGWRLLLASLVLQFPLLGRGWERRSDLGPRGLGAQVVM